MSAPLPAAFAVAGAEMRPAPAGKSPLTVLWISDFPVEWLDDVPPEVAALPRQHPMTWQRVLLEQWENRPDLRLHIVCLRKNNSAREMHFERRGVHFHILPTRRGGRAPSLFWHDTFLIRPLVEKIRPDLVHAWGTERGAALVAPRLGRPWLLTMQGLMNWYLETDPDPVWHLRLAAWLEQWALARPAVVTAESRFALNYLGRHFPQLNLHQVEHAPATLFHRLERRPRLAPRRFLHVGTLGKRKGTDFLLEMLEGLRAELDFELVLVGKPDGAFAPVLEQWLRSPLGARLRWKESLSPTEIAAELAEAQLFLFPAQADNSPNAVKEAVVAGVPVIGSAVGGIPDYVVSGENGLLCPPGDTAAWQAAVRTACAHPLWGRGEVDASIWQDRRAYLSPVLMGEKFLAVYHQVLASSRARIVHATERS